MPVNYDLMNLMGGQAMGPAPQVTPGGEGVDWNLISMMLGQGAQAFSAADPTSWQHQLGGLASGLGQSRKYAQAATKAQAGRSALTQAMIDLMRGGPTPEKVPGLLGMKIGKDKVTFDVTPDRDFWELGPLAIGGMEAAGGAPESLQTREPLTQPREPSLGIGGPGGRSANIPFTQPRPTDLLPPTWWD